MAVSCVASFVSRPLSAIPRRRSPAVYGVQSRNPTHSRTRSIYNGLGSRLRYEALGRCKAHPKLDQATQLAQAYTRISSPCSLGFQYTFGGVDQVDKDSGEVEQGNDSNNSETRR
ncbi:hypothetical protein V6N12_002603 [Hibiscus sabdariffa]|uniref:Uncharacterized protein n=1 Tax=Hibiscus sabdariffa TaxID=183260 RepID=A0ABR2E9F8_9ROSI